MSIRRQLCIAATYAREAREDDLKLVLMHLSSLESKCDEIIEILIDIWRDNSTTTTTNTVQSSSLLSPTASPAEVLRIALNVSFLTSKASIACLECIHEGIISGRSAIFCISEIRISLLSLISTNISCIENDDNIKQKAAYVHEIANLILQPFLTNNNIVSDLQSITCCLDLIPVAISALFNLRKQYSFLAKMDIQVINSFFDSVVPLSASILNILTEIYPRLRNRHLIHIKKQVIALVPKLQRQCDEFPGIMRICLRFFEQSNDAQWIHIFRVLYASVPLSEMQNIEALLEQILSQSGRIDQSLIDILEDTAAHFCKCITNKATTVAQRSIDDEIPLICLADIRLLLMTMRITNTSNLHLNLMLPSIVSGNAEESSTGIRNSRALIMLLISFSLVSHYEPQVYKELYKDSAFIINNVCNIDTITKNLCRTVHCCLVDESGRISSWLSSVRGMEIISACMYSVFYPSVTQSCTNFISQCIISRYENDIIGSRSNNFDDIDTATVSPEEVVQEINISELLSECLITVFQDINDCRSSLLSLVMKGLVACFQSTRMFKVNFLIAEETFIKLFRDICYRHPRILAQSHSSLENYILTASVLPVVTLERILFPLICCLSNAIYGYLITCYRKCLLHPYAERKSFAIKSLLSLLPQVQAPCQMDIIQTLLHSFSLPLACRILFYTELTRLIWDHDLSTSDTSSSSSSSSTSSSSSSSSSSSDNASIGKISKTVLSSIQQKVLSRLSQYFVYEQDNVDEESWMGLVFCPDKCTIQFQKVKGYGCATEDVGALLLLSFTLELKTNKSNVLEFMKEISVVINDGIDKPSSVSLAEPGTSVSTTKSKVFEMIRRICSATDMEKTSVQEEHCFSSLSFIMGIVRFLALGLPFHPSLALAFKGTSCFANHEASNTAEKKSNDAEIFEHYLVCCFNIIDGLLKCFIISLQSIDTISNDNDTKNLKQAIMSIQAILDVLFDTATAVTTAVEFKGFQSLQKYVADKIIFSDVPSSTSLTRLEDTSNIAIPLTVAESLINSSKELIVENFLSKMLLSSADLSSTIATSSSSNELNRIYKKSTAYPFSMSVGILGYACYEASLAASSLSSSVDMTKNETQIGANLNITSCSRNLDKLLIEVEDAYMKVVSIAMEDSLLEAAIEESYKIYNNDINSGAVANPNNMVRKSSRMKSKKRSADNSDCSDIDSDSEFSSIALGKSVKIFDLVTGYSKSKHDTTNNEKSNDNADDNSNNETSCEEMSDKKDIACSMYLSDSCMSLMIAGFIYGLGSGIVNNLTRWDILPLRKNLSSLTHNQYRKTVWGMVRVKIFALRNEMLSAIATIIHTMNNNDILSSDQSYLSIAKRIQLSNYYARELLSAIKEGMTIRTVRAYLELLEALAFPWVTSTESSSFLSSSFSTNHYNNAHDTSLLLQEVLSYLDSSQTSIFKTLLNVMMMYATRLDGLIQCEEIAVNIIFCNSSLAITSDNNTMDVDDNNDNVIELNDNDMTNTNGVRKVAASSLAADTILGEILKYIDGILRDEINRKPASSSSSSSSLLSNKQSTERTTIREICNRICKFAFRLLDYTTNNATDEVDNSKQPLLLLLSDKRKNQVLAIFSRIVSRCIKETMLLNKVLQQCHLKNSKKEINNDGEYWNHSSDDDDDDDDDINEKKTNDIKFNFDVNINSVDFLIAVIVGISAASFETAKDIIADTINYRPVNNRKSTSSVIKRAHALGFKVEELQWRLLHLLQEIQKQKKNNSNFERHIATMDSDLCIPFLSESFHTIDGAGHDMLHSILQSNDDDNSKKNIKNSKKRRKIKPKNHDDDVDRDDADDDDDDQDDDDEEEEEDDDDDDDSIDLDAKDNHRKASKPRVRNTAALLSSSSSSRKSKAKRMRSRNRVIDEWLDADDGDDNYADLEDFVING